MKRLGKLASWAVTAAVAAVAIVYVLRHSDFGEPDQAWTPSAQAAVEMPANLKPAASPGGELPSDADFRLVAESESLRLYADANTGHFQVEDKRDGHVLRSYPDPDDWPLETISGTWRNHLRSPILLETIDLTLTATKPEVKVNSLLSLNGGIADFHTVDGGFSVTFAMPSIDMLILVEVRLRDDYVETKVVDEGIREGKDSLLNLKVYPFLGAEQPRGQDGYLLLPDGSGALYRFKDNATGDRSIYRDAIYGGDLAFNSVYTNRKAVALPVYGIKSGDSAFLAVADQGAAFGYMYAAPSGVYGKYAWATVEHNYRLQYYQPTSQDQTQGFLTYSKIKFGGDRTVRYYVLPKDQADYSGMAAKYREYLMKEKGLKPVVSGSSGSEDLPLYVDIIGGDLEKGFLRSRYIVGTTTDEAKSIVDRLHEQGIDRLVVTYKGWQRGGVSTAGFGAETDPRLGGDDGMRSFAAYVRSKGDTLLLETDYTVNNDGRSFDAKRQGMQDQAGTLLRLYNNRSDSKITLVSPRVSLEKLQANLEKFASLGANGLQLDGVGQTLFSDYNARYGADRSQAADVQSDMLAAVRAKLEHASVLQGNAYVLGQADAIRAMPNDYSYDLFMDEAVPFAQMALHGLVPYTLGWGNTRDEYRKDFLRAVEYGAAPAFLVMNAETKAMKRAYSVWQYSLNYDEWEPAIKRDYDRLNEALGDVQDEFIVGNRTVAPNVKETTYAQGKRIVVNYNTFPVTVDGRQIPAMDFIVVEGGGSV